MKFETILKILPILIIGAIGVQTIGCSSDGDGGGTQSGVSSSSGGDSGNSNSGLRMQLAWDSEHDLYLAVVTPSGDTLKNENFQIEEGLYEVLVNLRTDSEKVASIDNTQYYLTFSYNEHSYTLKGNIAPSTSENMGAGRMLMRNGDEVAIAVETAIVITLTAIVIGFIGPGGIFEDGFKKVLQNSGLEGIWNDEKITFTDENPNYNPYGRMVDIVGTQGCAGLPPGVSAKLAEIQGCPNVFLFDGESIVDLTGGDKVDLNEYYMFCDLGNVCHSTSVANCLNHGYKVVSSCPDYPRQIYNCYCLCHEESMGKTWYSHIITGGSSTPDCPGIEILIRQNLNHCITPVRREDCYAELI